MGITLTNIIENEPKNKNLLKISVNSFSNENNGFKNILNDTFINSVNNLINNFKNEKKYDEHLKAFLPDKLEEKSKQNILKPKKLHEIDREKTEKIKEEKDKIEKIENQKEKLEDKEKDNIEPLKEQLLNILFQILFGKINQSPDINNKFNEIVSSNKQLTELIDKFSKDQNLIKSIKDTELPLLKNNKDILPLLKKLIPVTENIEKIELREISQNGVKNNSLFEDINHSDNNTNSKSSDLKLLTDLRSLLIKHLTESITKDDRMAKLLNNNLNNIMLRQNPEVLPPKLSHLFLNTYQQNSNTIGNTFKTFPETQDIIQTLIKKSPHSDNNSKNNTNQSGDKNNFNTNSITKNSNISFINNLNKTKSSFQTKLEGKLEQIIDRFKMFEFNGKHEMRITLQPESLGRLFVKLSSYKGNVSAKVFTEGVEVQNLLKDGVEHLKQVLSDQGVKIDQLMILVDPKKVSENFEDFDKDKHNKENQVFSGKKFLSGKNNFDGIDNDEINEKIKDSYLIDLRI